MDMLASDFAGSRVNRENPGGEHVLPGPIGCSLWVFSVQGIGQIDCPMAFVQVGFMQPFAPGQVLLQCRFDGYRKSGHPVFCAFSIADDNLALLEIEVFDAKPDSLHNAETPSV